MLRIIQSISFAGATFFTYPWRPVFAHALGDGRDVGYKHFRRDHHSPLCLLAHVIALYVQVLGNFLLLFQMDSLLFTEGERYLSFGTAFVWGLSLLLTSHGAPFVAKASALLILAVAAYVAPFIDPYSIQTVAIVSFFILFILADALPIRGKRNARVSM